MLIRIPRLSYATYTLAIRLKYVAYVSKFRVALSRPVYKGGGEPHFLKEKKKMDPVQQRLLLAEEINLLAAIAVVYVRRANRRRQRRGRGRKTCWVKPWLLRRPIFGQYEHLLQELNREDIRGFKNFLRIPPELFHEMVERVGPLIEKKDTFWRKALDPGLKIAITLRYLATGDSYKSLQYGFRVAVNTICNFIPTTCQAIIEAYMEECLQSPMTAAAWEEVAEGFSRRWNFHNCLGAVDGKHVAIRCPGNSGTFYYNYKGFHSIVLMAVVDANYKFIYVDIGANGICSDGGVFRETGLCKAVEGGRAGIPPPTSLPNDDQPIPYAFVGDDAFGLRTWLMKPFPHHGLSNSKRIFNYRLSRARRVVENAFGILSHR